MMEKLVLDFEEDELELGGAPKDDLKSFKAKEVSQERGGKYWVWDHFTKVNKLVFEMQNGKRIQVCERLRVQCNWCKSDLAYDGKLNGTSTMGRHIENVCKKYSRRVRIDDGQQKLTSIGHSKGMKEMVMVKWTEQGCRETAVKMMVIDELPFTFIEKDGFRYFCRYVVPDWHVPSRRVIVKQFLSMYEAERLNLKKI